MDASFSKGEKQKNEPDSFSLEDIVAFFPCVF